MFLPVDRVTIGTEVIWGRRENFRDGFNADDVHLQFIFKYNFIRNSNSETNKSGRVAESIGKKTRHEETWSEISRRDFKSLFKPHPHTAIIWAHIGAGRLVCPVKEQAPIVEDIVKDPQLPNVYFDISWMKLPVHCRFARVDPERGRYRQSISGSFAFRHTK